MSAHAQVYLQDLQVLREIFPVFLTKGGVNYAPNFKKVDGAYCFWSVRGCVRGWVTLFVPTVTLKPLKLES